MHPPNCSSSGPVQQTTVLLGLPHILIGSNYGVIMVTSHSPMQALTEEDWEELQELNQQLEELQEAGLIPSEEQVTLTWLSLQMSDAANECTPRQRCPPDALCMHLPPQCAVRQPAAVQA